MPVNSPWWHRRQPALHRPSSWTSTRRFSLRVLRSLLLLLVLVASWTLIATRAPAQVAGSAAQPAAPTWPLDPQDVAYGGDLGGGTAFVVSGLDSGALPWRLWLANLQARTLSATAVTGHGWLWVVADPGTGHVFAGDGVATSIEMLDTRTGRLLRTVHLGRIAQMPSVGEAAQRLYVPVDPGTQPGASGAIVVLDIQDGHRVSTFPVPGDPYSVTSAPCAHRLLVQDSRATLWILDAQSGKLVASYAARGSLSPVAVDEQTCRVFVSQTGISGNGALIPGSIVTLDARTGRQVQSVATPIGSSASAPVIDPQTSRVFVSTDERCLGSATCMAHVLMLDAHSGALLATQVVGREASTLLLDARDARVVVTANDTGSVTTLDARCGRVLATLALGPALGASFLDVARGRLLVTVLGPMNQIGDAIGPGDIAVFDIKRAQVVRRVEAGWNPSVQAIDDQTGSSLVIEQGLHLLPDEPAQSAPDRWSWVPAWLRCHLPFITAPSQIRNVPPVVTILAGL